MTALLKLTCQSDCRHLPFHPHRISPVSKIHSVFTSLSKTVLQDVKQLPRQGQCEFHCYLLDKARLLFFQSFHKFSPLPQEVQHCSSQFMRVERLSKTLPLCLCTNSCYSTQGVKDSSIRPDMVTTMVPR